MFTRRGLLRGLAQIAVLGPLALRRLPKVLGEAIPMMHTVHFDEDGQILRRWSSPFVVHTREEMLAWQDNGVPLLAPTPGATS